MVLDLHMPGMTGIELCMYLRGTEATAGLTIVSMSGAAQPADVQLLAELGVSRFVAKGVSLLPRLTELLAELTVNA